MMVLCCCDNRAVVDVVNSGYSRDKDMMNLLCCYFYLKTSPFSGRGSPLTRKEEGCSKCFYRVTMPLNSYRWFQRHRKN